MSPAPAASIWLVGCGNMGGAMLRRWIDSRIDPSRIIVIDPGDPQVPAGVRVRTAPPEDVMPETLVLAVKPQQLDSVAERMGPHVAGVRLLMSILAGVEEGALADRFGAQTTVRVMPNLPVGIGKGVVALYSSSRDGRARARAEQLMKPLGLVEWIGSEDKFDAVTALSGCGPGFVFRFIDALAAAGRALGLPADQALRLAKATVEGSATMAAEAGETPGVLADRVASPGGSTREGMNVLDHEDALKKLMLDTLTASARRNSELAEAARR
ncbi:MAG: pyrroline-5-carboxylate reductase [Pseudomonadota bacterium]